MDDATRVRSRSFGAVVDAYDRYRPSYPPELVDAVAGRLPLGGRVVDVGCGTGRATVALAERRLRVTALDPDQAMADRCRSRCASLPSVEVVCSTFEDWDGPLGALDGVTAGQSWHWIDQDVGIDQAAALLRPGGLLALFWNTASPEGADALAALREVYRAHVPGLCDSSGVMTPVARTEEHGDRLAASGAFTPPERAHWDWVRDFTTEEYIGLLGTHSDHSTLPDEVRRPLLDAVARCLDADGGVLRYRYRSQLVMAERLVT